MSGYGGFGKAHLPEYNTAVAELWLKRGGYYVYAHIRGGNEFGESWYQQGAGNRKVQSHDDFAAIAADLVARNISKPNRIGAEGISNGGLLIANMLTRYPDRFGALVASCSLTDMINYNRIDAKCSFIDEYGNPNDPENLIFLREISAFHNIAYVTNYPPSLFITTTSDDRVPPIHSQKMVSKLQTNHHEAYLYQNSTGGYGYGRTADERAHNMAMIYAFLWHHLRDARP